jgi:hypothetical protein
MSENKGENREWAGGRAERRKTPMRAADQRPSFAFPVPPLPIFPGLSLLCVAGIIIVCLNV